MKELKGFGHILFLISTLLVLQACMPDTMSKWEEEAPLKKEAPVVLPDPPDFYGYFTALSGTDTVSYDVGSGPITLVKDTTFVGTEVTFTVSPTLPLGITLNANTGDITIAPTAVNELKEYTFTATNSAGSTDFAFKIGVTLPDALGELTYQDINVSPFMLKVGATYVLNPTLDGNSTDWTIEQGAAYALVADGDTDYPSSCYGLVVVVKGMCLNPVSGIIRGIPLDSSVPITFKIKASKTDPASSSTTTFTLGVENSPEGLVYSQTSTVELQLSNTDTSLAAASVGNYIRIVDTKGTTSTLDDTNAFAKIVDYTEDTSSTTLIVDKIDPNIIYKSSFIINGVASSIVLGDLSAPSAVSTTIIGVLNNVEPEKTFELTPSLTAGENIVYSISPALDENFDAFDSSTGIIKGSLPVNFETREYTITASNSVDSVQSIIKISPFMLSPSALSYSNQLLIKVRNADEFMVGEEISTSTTSETNGIGRGKIIYKYSSAATQTDILVVDMLEGSFSTGDPLDDKYVFSSEESDIGGYFVLRVKDTTDFAVGEFISNENAALGKVRYIDSSNKDIYIKLLNGQFSYGDSIDDALAFAAAATTVDGVEDDTLISGSSATLTLKTTSTTSAGVTLPNEGSTLSTNGIVNLANINFVEDEKIAVLTLDSDANFDKFSIGDFIISDTVADNPYGVIYFKERGTRQVYVSAITDSDTSNGIGDYTAAAVSLGTTPGSADANIVAVIYGYKANVQVHKGALSEDETISIDGSLSTTTIDLIEANSLRATLASTGTTANHAVIANGISMAQVSDLTPGGAPNDSQFTADTTGILNYYDSVTGYAYITTLNSTFVKGMDFDTLNPIMSLDTRIYPNTATVSTTSTILLKRGVPFKLKKSIYKNVNAKYSVFPNLPQGVNLDVDTGEISGTPEVASTFKTYVVTAVNEKNSVTYNFNLKIDEFIEISVDGANSAGGASYIIHRTGKKNNSRACSVTKDQVNSNNYEDLDIVCRLEAGEADLYNNGVKFDISVGPGMCNHFVYRPYYYYGVKYNGPSTPATENFYNLDNIACVFTDEADLDGGGPGDVDLGFNDGVDMNGGGTGTDIVAQDGICQPDEDIDGDGDCTPLEDLDGDGLLTGTVATMFSSYINGRTFAANDELGTLCQSHTNDINCDNGTYNLRTITAAPLSELDSRCLPSSGTFTDAQDQECGGSQTRCIDGAIRDEYSPDDLEKGLRSRISTMSIDSVTNLNYTVTAPNDRPLRSGENKYIADYSILHNYFNVSANRDDEYTLDIQSFLNAFTSASPVGAASNDPLAGGYPMYTFECLDAASDPIARIHVQIRDWDTTPNIAGPIDKNNKLVSAIGAAETFTTNGTATIDLDGAATVDSSVIKDNAKVLLSVDGGTTWTRYSVDTAVDGSGSFTVVTNLTVATAPAPPVAVGGITAIYLLIEPTTDEISISGGSTKILGTMDTTGIIDATFGSLFNSHDDWDDDSINYVTPTSGNRAFPGYISEYPPES